MHLAIPAYRGYNRAAMRTDYFQQVLNRLQAVMESQQQAMEQAAEWLADALTADHLIWIFGASHAGILTEELVYRAGGLAPVSPIFIPGLTCDVRPITLTSTLERLDGYAAAAIREVPIQPGDVLIVHSVSGRNAAPVEVAVWQGAGRTGHRPDLARLLPVRQPSFPHGQAAVRSSRFGDR